MKKQLLVLLICLAVAAALCLSVSLPGGFTQKTQSSGSNSGTSLSGSTGSTATSPGTTGTGTGPIHTIDPDNPPEVRLYVCGREDADACQALAEQYAAFTGASCRILSGDLETLMASETPPTIFCLHSQAQAEQWQTHLYDLSGQSVLDQLYSPDFALTINDKPSALAMDVTAYGIIYNAELLSKAGYTRVDFTDFSSFSQKVDAVTEKTNSLGCHPFCTPDWTDRNLVSLLVGSTEDPQQLRQLIDEILTNDTPLNDPVAGFTGGKIAFYIGGAWEYEQLAPLGFNKLDILPFFTDDGGSLPCICDTYWAVNSQSSAQDIAFSLDFLLWMVSAQEGGAALVDSLGFIAPFQGADAGDLFTRRLIRKYISTEPITVRWEIAPGLTEARLAELMPLLQSYAANPTDENWFAVAQLLSE